MNKSDAIMVRDQMNDPDSGFSFIGFDTNDTGTNYVILAQDLYSQEQVRFATLRQWHDRWATGLSQVGSRQTSNRQVNTKNLEEAAMSMTKQEAIQIRNQMDQPGSGWTFIGYGGQETGQYTIQALKEGQDSPTTISSQAEWINAQGSPRSTVASSQSTESAESSQSSGSSRSRSSS